MLFVFTRDSQIPQEGVQAFDQSNTGGMLTFSCAAFVMLGQTIRRQKQAGNGSSASGQKNKNFVII